MVTAAAQRAASRSRCADTLVRGPPAPRPPSRSRAAAEKGRGVRVQVLDAALDRLEGAALRTWPPAPCEAREVASVLLEHRHVRGTCTVGEVCAIKAV